MSDSDAPPPALGELARRATAVIEAEAELARYPYGSLERAWAARATGIARNDFRAAATASAVLQLVALASGGAAAGDEFHTYTLLLDKYLDSYRGAIEAESDAGPHAPTDPDTDRAYERASIRRAKLDAYVAQRLRALTPERPADATS